MPDTDCTCSSTRSRCFHMHAHKTDISVVVSWTSIQFFLLVLFPKVVVVIVPVVLFLNKQLLFTWHWPIFYECKFCVVGVSAILRIFFVVPT